MGARVKKFKWTFEMGDEDISGEADTREEAEKQMEACGYDENEMEGVITEMTDEQMVAHARAIANAKRPRTSLQELAAANASMFAQVDDLKNTLATLEQRLSTALFDARVYETAATDSQALLGGLRELVLAWNTEQQARKGEAHTEPAFVDILRGWGPSKSLMKRKVNHAEEKQVEKEGVPGQ